MYLISRSTSGKLKSKSMSPIFLLALTFKKLSYLKNYKEIYILYGVIRRQA